MFDFVSTSQSHALCGGRARSKLQTSLVIIMPPHLAAIHAYGLLVQAQHRYPFRMQVRSGLTSGGSGLFQALSLKPAILMEALTHPGWIVEYFRRGGGTPMLQNWQPYAPAGSDAEAVYKYSSSLRPFNAQTWRDLENYRRKFPRALVVKGITDPADALRAAEIGRDGIIVSNHRGRQLDQPPASLDVLPAIKAAVGEKNDGNAG